MDYPKRLFLQPLSGTGLWYRAGKGVIKVRWVYVQDRSGTHREEYLYSTDVNLTPAQIVWKCNRYGDLCDNMLG